MVTNGPRDPPRELPLRAQDVRIDSPSAAAAALGWLEDHAGPDGRRLPDGQELDRLHDAADGRARDGWSAWFDPATAYLARPATGPGDLIPAQGVAPAALSDLVSTAVPAGLDAWIRDVDDAHPVLALHDVNVSRRLLVLEHGLDEPLPDPRAPIEAFQPDRDHAALLRLLADAYAGTPDGWDAERVVRETTRAAFAPDDILVARSTTRPGELDGAHWTLRRDDRTGEVHNLSVHPGARGHGLADDLLVAGLAYLQAAGCERVILWVDADNEAGRRLYARRDFTTAWVDALVELAPA